jgi:hyperosmotically inducible protein
MTILSRRLLTLAATGLLLAGASISGAKTAGQTIDDSALAAKTKAALLESTRTSGTTLNVEVRKGKVQVGGFANDAAARAAALAVAAEAAGGKANVLDAIVVVPGGRATGQTLDDTTTQAKLKAALVGKLGQGISVNTDVRRGEALLSGFVNLEGSKTKAGEIAKSVSGVTKVHNMLAVSP